MNTRRKFIKKGSLGILSSFFIPSFVLTGNQENFEKTLINKKEAINMSIPKEVKKQVWRIVKIVKKVSDGFIFCSSGFFIIHRNNKYVVTNEHVINKNKCESEFWVADIEKKAYPLTLIQTNLKHDFALLKTDISTSTIETDIELLNGDFNPGLALYTAGFDDRDSSNNIPNFQEGTLKSRHILIIKKDSVEYAPDGYIGEVALGFVVKGFECDTGASGSPVFKSDGKIIGYVKGYVNNLSDKEVLCIAINNLYESLP